MSLIDLFPATRRAMRNTRDDVSTLSNRVEEIASDLRSIERSLDSLQCFAENTQKLVMSLQRQFVEFEEGVSSVKEGVSSVKEGVSSVKEGVSSVKEGVSSYGSKAETLLWALYREPGETTEHVRKRFFQSLPPATGNMRLLQRCTAQLMREFDLLCKANDISYWLDFGSCLGAARHKGFVPWDDDADVGMMRTDVQKIISIVEGDPNYEITVLADPYVFCRQIRFRYSDKRIPCFVDLFMYDEASRGSSEEYCHQKELRNRMITELKGAPWYEGWLAQGPVAENSEFGAQIFEIMRRYISKANEALRSETNSENGICYGIDNIDLGTGSGRSLKKSDVFPTESMEFEGAMLSCPADVDTYLSNIYGDYWSLPNDIDTHFQHISDNELFSPEVIAAMNELLRTS